MKTFIFIITVILLPLILSGQIENHFQNMTSKWYVANSYPNGDMNNPNFIETETTIYGFKGDTILNGKNWNKIYSTKDSLFMENLVYEGILRSENNFVVFINPNNQLDTIYNFDLTIGDSIKYDLTPYGDNDYEGSWIFVRKIDTVLIHNQIYRKFYFTEPTNIYSAMEDLNEIWIEGIGSIHGPIFPNKPHLFSTEFSENKYLTCSYTKSEIYYQNPTVSECYLRHKLGVKEELISDFKISPNPAKDFIQISLPFSKDVEYFLSDSQGRILQKGIVNSLENRINLSHFNSNLYFLTIILEELQITKKIVKL